MGRFSVYTSPPYKTPNLKDPIHCDICNKLIQYYETAYIISNPYNYYNSVVTCSELCANTYVLQKMEV